MIDETLSLAIVKYLGYGKEIYPKYDEKYLIKEFGKEQALQLQPKIDEVFKSLGSIVPDWNKHTLNSGADWAINIMHKRYPELNSEALRALYWAFSFGWK